MSTMKDIQDWLAAEMPKASSRRKAELERLAAHLKRQESEVSPAALPPGFQRQLARQRERRVMREAMRYGYEPPEEVMAQLGLHLAEQSLGIAL